jgi:1,4-alpha-glucan branching enzyme
MKNDIAALHTEAPALTPELGELDLHLIAEGRHRELGRCLVADRLIPYVTGLGFTHVELMPIMEHPFGGSWGYQPLASSRRAPASARPRPSRGFVDRCHQAGLGVILDWVPAHFPSDEHGSSASTARALRARRPARRLPPRLEHADLQSRPRTRCAAS